MEKKTIRCISVDCGYNERIKIHNSEIHKIQCPVCGKPMVLEVAK